MLYCMILYHVIFYCVVHSTTIPFVSEFFSFLELWWPRPDNFPQPIPLAVVSTGCESLSSESYRAQRRRATLVERGALSDTAVVDAPNMLMVNSYGWKQTTQQKQWKVLMEQLNPPNIMKNGFFFCGCKIISFNKWFIKNCQQFHLGVFIHWDDHPTNPCSKAASRWPRIYENLRPSVDSHEFGCSGGREDLGNFCEKPKERCWKK